LPSLLLRSSNPKLSLTARPPLAAREPLQAGVAPGALNPSTAVTTYTSVPEFVILQKTRHHQVLEPEDKRGKKSQIQERYVVSLSCYFM